MIKNTIISALATLLIISKAPLSINTTGEMITLFFGLLVVCMIAFVWMEDVAEKAWKKYQRSKRLQRRVRNLTRR